MNTSQEPNPDATGDSGFPHAPADWQPGEAERIAADEGLELGPDHWRMLRCLQEYFSRSRKLFTVKADCAISTEYFRVARWHRAAAWPGWRCRPARSTSLSAACTSHEPDNWGQNKLIAIPRKTLI